MKHQAPTSETAIRTTIQAAVAAHAMLRVYVPEMDDDRRSRVIEGIPRSFIPGRDGRDRVIVVVQTANEPVEIRLLVDRITRVERIDGDGKADPAHSAGHADTTENKRPKLTQPTRPASNPTVPSRPAAKTHQATAISHPLPTPPTAPGPRPNPTRDMRKPSPR